MKKAKALVLFSGGLDSILAVAVLRQQNIEVTALGFESNFYDAKKAKESAKALGIKIRTIDISKDMLALTKNPPNGYGKNMNPCIDCHGLMFGRAGNIMREQDYDLLATGEVLGQRPFSQNKEALAKVENLAGVDILRPLSAKLLKETNYEKRGLVVRGRLLRIKGRSREEQTKLAKKFNIGNYPSPSGGCLLTDPEFSGRLLKMFDYYPDCQIGDVELLKNGRIFWLSLKSGQNKKVLVVVGRDHEENENLKKLARSGDIMVELKEIVGPLALARCSEQSIKYNEIINNYTRQASTSKFQVLDKLELSKLELNKEKNPEEAVKTVAMLVSSYATKARGKMVEVEIKEKD